MAISLIVYYYEVKSIINFKLLPITTLYRSTRFNMLHYFTGFNVETIHVDGVNVTAWDVGTRDKMVRLILYGNNHHDIPDSRTL